MRTLAKNKQKMYYALQSVKVPIYEYDEDGNIKYITIDGEQVPVETGEYELGYSEPVEFFANINNKLTEIVWQSYGIDDSTKYAQIVASKGELPLKAGSVIWKKSDVGYKDGEKTIVDANTADYVVKGVADEGLTEDLFLLQRNVK